MLGLGLGLIGICSILTIMSFQIASVEYELEERIKSLEQELRMALEDEDDN